MTSRSSVVAACLYSLLLFSSPAISPAETDPPAEPPQHVRSAVQQVRIYEINPPNEWVFHSRFRDHTLRIMERHGFDVRQAWRSVDERGTVRFVYLLNWADRTSIKPAWDAFLADPEWQRVKQESGAKHGKFVNAIADHILEPIALDGRANLPK